MILIYDEVQEGMIIFHPGFFKSDRQIYEVSEFLKCLSQSYLFYLENIYNFYLILFQIYINLN